MTTIMRSFDLLLLSEQTCDGTCLGHRWRIAVNWSRKVEPRNPDILVTISMNSLIKLVRSSSARRRSSRLVFRSSSKSSQQETRPVAPGFWEQGLVEGVAPVAVRSEERRVGKECRCS